MSVQKRKKLRKENNDIDHQNAYYVKMLSLKNRLEHWDDLFHLDIIQRTKFWNKFDTMWDPLRDKYAWAVPDKKSLHIIKSFSPLVEIGAGKGYWAMLLSRIGTDIIAYDKYTSSSSKDNGINNIKSPNWFHISEGGPEVLLNNDLHSRNLFLCFPDESESISIVCLENFKGDYILHIGELITSTVGTLGSAPQAPFGRTSSGEFQIALAAKFHCILDVALEITVPFGRERLTIWKRTNYILGRNFNNNNNENTENEVDTSDTYSNFNKEYFSNLYEHEKMLADQPRMSFYYQSISRYVKKGMHVIDLGTGTGILAAFAERSGASKVTAIDHSEIINQAKTVAIANQLKNIEFHQIHSTELEMEKVDMILHEQMGDCLFDEDMIASVTDLRNRLLKPTGVILPSCFDFFCEPIKICDERHIPFIYDMTNIYGINLSCLKKQQQQQQQDRDYFHYRSSDPSLVDYFLSQPQPILSFDLHTIIQSELPREVKFSREIQRDGRLDGLVVYFRVCVDDDLILCSGPQVDRAPHWGFRILRVASEEFLIGDIIDITLTIHGQWSELNTWRWKYSKREKVVDIKDSIIKKRDNNIMKNKQSKKNIEKVPLKANSISSNNNNNSSSSSSSRSSSGGNKKHAKVNAKTTDLDCEFISLADLAKLREQNNSHSVANIKEEEEEEEEEEDSDYDDHNNPKKRRKDKNIMDSISDNYSESGSQSESDSGSEDDDPYANLTDIQSLREMDLDRQYAEDDNKRWAAIPPDEMMKEDRVAPCLIHLLEKSTTTTVSILSGKK